MRVVTFIVLLSIVVFSCKKKTDTPMPSESSPTSSPPSAILSANYVIRDSFGVISHVDSTAFAAFCKDSSFLNVNCITVGTVKFNDTILPFDTYFYYSVNKRVSVFGNYVWSSSGSSIFPAFTYTVTHPYPVYLGGNLLPDTIDRSNGLYVPIVSKFNCTSIDIRLPLDFSNTEYQFQITNDSIKLTPMFLNNYGNGLNKITLYFSNTSFYKNGNNKFKFNSILIYEKWFVFKT